MHIEASFTHFTVKSIHTWKKNNFQQQEPLYYDNNQMYIVHFKKQQYAALKNQIKHRK